MKVERPELSPAEMRVKSQAWYERQLETLKLAHGDRWPEHEEWLKAYLREELRMHLLKHGWRPKW